MKKQLNKYKKLFINKPKAIDVFGLLLIFFVISLVYLLLNRKVEYLNVTLRLFNYEGPEYSYGSNKPRSWYVEQIVPGKKQKDGLGKTLIEVIDVYSYPGPAVYQDAYVVLRVRVAQNRNTKQYIYNGSPLLIHDVKSFKVQDLLISGEIIDMYTKPRQLGKFKVELKLNPQGFTQEFENSSIALIEGVENYIFESLQKGMTIKDSNGLELVVVKDIVSESGRRTMATDGGYMSVIDPKRTQVILVLDIIGENNNNHYYYRKDAPLIIDQKLHLIFDNIAVYGTIISVESLTVD